ncbi:hypothetical protein BJ875DRAFT_526835 [Amylocarpus encephaloides]|uniref:Uncharacterized protein n=1 Tax=Amylocarpus encephaloides TaxID=45428 RepID=A0A9P7YLW0_9HELO|nr:hypothetical protein BJ875DRAFT_526835 [Amylocarpus encephaloides]
MAPRSFLALGSCHASLFSSRENLGFRQLQACALHGSANNMSGPEHGFLDSHRQSPNARRHVRISTTQASRQTPARRQHVWVWDEIQGRQAPRVSLIMDHRAVVAKPRRFPPEGSSVGFPNTSQLDGTPALARRCCEKYFRAVAALFRRSTPGPDPMNAGAAPSPALTAQCVLRIKREGGEIHSPSWRQFMSSSNPKREVPSLLSRIRGRENLPPFTSMQEPPMPLTKSPPAAWAPGTLNFRNALQGRVRRRRSIVAAVVACICCRSRLGRRETRSARRPGGRNPMLSLSLSLAAAARTGDQTAPGIWIRQATASSTRPRLGTGERYWRWWAEDVQYASCFLGRGGAFIRDLRASVHEVLDTCDWF